MSTDNTQTIYMLDPYDFKEVGWLRKVSEVENHRKRRPGNCSLHQGRRRSHNSIISLVILNMLLNMTCASLFVWMSS